MSKQERKQYNSKGILTIRQLSIAFRPRRRPKRLREKREKYHHSLKALAIRENRIHIVGRPELKITGTPIFFDVESVPDRNFHYLIGMRIVKNDCCVQLSKVLLARSLCPNISFFLASAKPAGSEASIF